MAKTGPGLYSDFKIYEDQFYTTYNDTIAQNVNVFNEGSNGTISMVPLESVGNFRKKAYFAQIANIVTRRDITTTAAVTDDELTSDETISPKLARRFQVGNTLDSFRKIGISPDEFADYIGEQAATAKLQDMLDTTLLCGVTALRKQVASFHNKGSNASNTLRYTYLTAALEKFGDKMSEIVLWVFHSHSFVDLMDTTISSLQNTTALPAVQDGIVGTINRPYIITDSASLINTDGVTSGTNSYYTLGLTAAGLAALETEPEEVVFERVTGLENLVFRAQGEYSYNSEVKGFSYTDTGVNPADAALGNTSNWTLKRASIKNTAGVVIEHA